MVRLLVLSSLVSLFGFQNGWESTFKYYFLLLVFVKLFNLTIFRKFDELNTNGEKVGENISLAESYAAVSSDVKFDQDNEFALGEDGVDTSCVEETPSDSSAGGANEKGATV
jgi:hypothetical protein